MQYLIFGLILFFALSTFSNVSFAQNYQPYDGPLISLGTDKSIYNPGDTVGIFGFVKQADNTSLIAIQITGSNGHVIATDNIPISSDGTYSYKIKATGDSWQTSGIYMITVHYVPTNVGADITFKFVNNTQSQVVPEYGSVAYLVLAFGLIMIVVFPMKIKTILFSK